MSLDGFYQGLAAMAADPALVVRTRAGDGSWLATLDLAPQERARLTAMASDGGMEVLCTLYRSGRLTALVGTAPDVVRGLGDRLSQTASDFWRHHPHTDMQFRNEGLAFCGFVRTRYPDDPARRAAVDDAERSVLDHYDATP